MPSQPDLTVPFAPTFRSGPPVTPSDEPPDVPASLAGLTSDAAWEQVWVKEGTEVWRVTGPTTTSYLKIGPANGSGGLVPERDRLVWLDGRLYTPRVLSHHVDGEMAWLLTGEVPGIPSHDPGLRLGSVLPMVQALGRVLRRFHDELPTESCPFDDGLDVLLAAAERRVAAGGVDPLVLSETYRRHSAEELLEHLAATRPPERDDDRVVAHGDPCLPNFLVRPSGDEVTGIVDVGRVGVSDRYRDLAILVRTLVQNFSPEVVHHMLDAYGLAAPDLAKLEFYVLLDEMW